MGFQDRTYYRDEPQPAGPIGSMRGMSVVTWLIVINAVVFVLDSIFTGSARASAISFTRWGNYNIYDAIYGLQFWRFLTYQFLHANFMHILFNMIGLFFFGRIIEQWWGPRRFLAFYLLCGVSGAVVFTALSLIPSLLPTGPGTYLIGASGSVFGILVACAVLFPNQRVMLMFPPIPMSMRTMALIFLGIAALQLIAGSHNAGGEAAHLGGALLGFILTKNPSWMAFADGGQLASIKKSQWERRQRKAREAEQSEQAEVDRILAKVKEHGLHSLTNKEKKTLQNATDRQRRAG
ncbi:MAG: rhomboid family intramembrane serine protease [Phycisphaera sp.]|nr:rhomboid family intramembrane serine protease [Phycisphaera sp.]